jgi:hypothetical protein
MIAIAGPAIPVGDALGQPPIPNSLEPWRDWVLVGEEYRSCPVLNGRETGREMNHVCAWPGRLMVDVDADGAQFVQDWTLHTDNWLPLPGDNRIWPQGVTVDETLQPAVLREGRPTVRVPAGEHRIVGTLAWQTRPASIRVPSETGLVALTLDGATVEQPELDGGTLWLGLRPDLVVEEDRLTIEVYRRLADGIPIRVETRIDLDVSGQSREAELDGLLLPDFIGESLASDLPAELDPDGTLRMQIRPGRWSATLIAHHPEMATTFARSPLVTPWPADEIWSFETNPALRVAVLEGGVPIDSQRAGVPFEWEDLPSYVVGAGQAVDLVERSRNDASDANRLRLERLIWLDFDGRGFTTQDRITGSMRSSWRIDTAPPYAMTMASVDNDNLLVTEGQVAGTQGVEVRAPTVDVVAVTRLASSATLPVTGYTERFDGVTTTMFLPPGYRLVAAPGADRTSQVWLERWRLLDIFVALIIAIAAWRLLGNLAGAVALITMALIFHEPWAPHYAWLNLLLIIALIRVVPEGRIRLWCRRYRHLSLAALLLLLIPFAAVELRNVVFPQLEQSFLGRGVASGQLARVAGFSAAQPGTQIDQLARERAGQRGLEAARVPAPGAESVIVTGSRMPFTPSRYLPGALVQTGPGLPDWAWNRYDLDFSGPVASDETFTAVIFGPWLVGIWRIAGVAAALAFAWLLLNADKLRGGTVGTRRSAGTAAAAILLLAPQLSEAQLADSFPSPQLLNELRQRLTDPAPCHPACAELTAARVDANATRLTLELEMAAQDSVAVPIPGRAEGWSAQEVTVDGQRVTTLYRSDDGTAWIPLEPGVHRVTLDGLIPITNSLTISFPLEPRRIAVAAPGWDVAGVADGRLPSRALELIRQSQADEDGDEIQTTAFPAFVRVTRALNFDIDWRIVTVVTRIAPAETAFTLPIDLLPNESIVTADVEVEGNQAVAAFAAGQVEVVWESRLPIAAALTLTAPEAAPWVEKWQLTTHHVWHAEFGGLPATPPRRFPDDFYRPEFLPRPGESLDITFSQPEPVSGDTIAIDDAVYTRNIGERASNAVLRFRYRSTRAVEHPIDLPAGSELESVSIDGLSVPLELDGTALSLPITPGEHEIEVRWRNLEGIGFSAAAAPVDLGVGASNITTRLNLPGERWTLFTYGPTLGPAVLYWAELAVFVLAAIVLGRIALSPLKTYEWLLLGLGLSTFSWPVLFLFAAWAFLMSLRNRNSFARSARLFNTWQVILALLTLGMLAALIGSIENGLLGSPNMHIVSPVERGTLSWFLDRTDGSTPVSGAVSVSLWFYKAAMLAWALWLSFALIRWLRWAWTAFSHDGVWRGKIATEVAD